MRINIKTSFRNDQSFYFFCKSLHLADTGLADFLQFDDTIIVDEHIENENILVVYYLQCKTSDTRALFCFDKNNVPPGDKMFKALVQSIKDAFAEEFI